MSLPESPSAGSEVTAALNLETIIAIERTPSPGAIATSFRRASLLLCRRHHHDPSSEVLARIFAREPRRMDGPAVAAGPVATVAHALIKKLCVAPLSSPPHLPD
jgi:hypothetical protein